MNVHKLHSIGIRYGNTRALLVSKDSLRYYRYAACVIVHRILVQVHGDGTMRILTRPAVFPRYRSHRLLLALVDNTCRSALHMDNNKNGSMIGFAQNSSCSTGLLFENCQGNGEKLWPPITLLYTKEHTPKRTANTISYCPPPTILANTSVHLASVTLSPPNQRAHFSSFLFFELASPSVRVPVAKCLRIVRRPRAATRLLLCRNEKSVAPELRCALQPLANALQPRVTPPRLRSSDE